MYITKPLFCTLPNHSIFVLRGTSSSTSRVCLAAPQQQSSPPPTAIAHPRRQPHQPRLSSALFMRAGGATRADRGAGGLPAAGGSVFSSDFTVEAEVAAVAAAGEKNPDEDDVPGTVHYNGEVRCSMGLGGGVAVILFGCGVSAGVVQFFSHSCPPPHTDAGIMFCRVFFV